MPDVNPDNIDALVNAASADPAPSPVAPDPAPAPEPTAPTPPAEPEPAPEFKTIATPDAQAPAQPPVDAEHAPLRNWQDIGDLGVEDGKLCMSMVESFKKPAVDLGLTPAQVRALAKWQVEYSDSEVAQRQAEQTALLKQAWGKDFNANCDAFRDFCARIERMPGCKGFCDAFVKCGAASDAMVVRALHTIGRRMSEDSVGALPGASAAAPETAYDGVHAAFEKARGGRQY